jgi:hypothetical protein
MADFPVSDRTFRIGKEFRIATRLPPFSKKKILRTIEKWMNQEETLAWLSSTLSILNIHALNVTTQALNAALEAKSQRRTKCKAGAASSTARSARNSIKRAAEKD